MDLGRFSGPSDRELLRRIARRPGQSVTALERLFARHARRLLAYILPRCPLGECQTIHRNVWGRVRNEAVDGVAATNIRAWLLGVALAEIGQRLMPAPAGDLRDSLDAFDPAVGEVIRARLRNESYGSIAQSAGHQVEKLYQVVETVRRRLTRRFGVCPIALTIPEDPAEAAGWLERHLVGARLNRLVAELAAVHSETANRPVYLAPILRGPRRDAVLDRGLAELSQRRIVALLTHPRLLLDLQELVLSAGRRYWDEVRPYDDRLETLVERTWLLMGAA
jgi:hypothetical protein